MYFFKCFTFTLPLPHFHLNFLSGTNSPQTLNSLIPQLLPATCRVPRGTHFLGAFSTAGLRDWAPIVRTIHSHCGQSVLIGVPCPHWQKMTLSVLKLFL